MAARKTGLGRGLGALLPVDDGISGYAVIPVSDIDPNPQQPRETFGGEALESLAASIKEVGILQPVVVRPADDEQGRFVLVAGERRLRAARLIGLHEIPAIVRAGDDVSSLTEALIENVQREDLSPLEEAAAYRQLLEDFGLTHEEIGARIGKSRSAVTNTLRLLQLPARVQALLAAGTLSAGAARALLGLEDDRFAEHIAATAADEGWSVRAVEEAVRARRGESDTARTVVTRERRERAAEIIELEEHLGERLGTPVSIDYGARGGGKLVIKFGSLDDLERIYLELSGS
ncbi:ParB/RepB/Spo0J family partition protein [bacterium]|nr:ParB/RepB/Spo0J family partition protein [bacterium]